MVVDRVNERRATARRALLLRPRIHAAPPHLGVEVSHRVVASHGMPSSLPIFA